jgi:hypothetical protein
LEVFGFVSFVGLWVFDFEGETILFFEEVSWSVVVVIIGILVLWLGEIKLLVVFVWIGDEVEEGLATEILGVSEIDEDSLERSL